MKEEVILMLSELRSKITDTISCIEKENVLEQKRIVSAMINAPFIGVLDHLGAKQSDFLEYLKLIGFINIVYKGMVSGAISYQREPAHEWIRYEYGRGWICHPALIALFEIYDKNR